MSWRKLSQWRNSLESIQESKTKKCLSCSESKSIFDFSWNKAYPDNRTPICRECISVMQCVDSVSRYINLNI